MTIIQRRSDEIIGKVHGNGSMDKARADSIALEEEGEKGMLCGVWR